MCSLLRSLLITTSWWNAECPLTNYNKCCEKKTIYKKLNKNKNAKNWWFGIWAGFTQEINNWKVSDEKICWISKGNETVEGKEKSLLMRNVDIVARVNNVGERNKALQIVVTE